MITLLFPHKSWIPAEDSIVVIYGASEKDYWELANEDIKVEYSKSRLFIHSPASLKHEAIQNFLLPVFNIYLEKNELGKLFGSRLAVHLPNGHRPEPDLVFLKEGTYNIDSDITFEGVPPLVIEILSKSTREFDLTEKLQWYTSAGIAEIWFIDHEKKELLRYTYDDTTSKYSEEKIESGLLNPLNWKDFTFKVEWLWELPKLSTIVHEK